jgi:hypothetical protein
MVVLPPPLARLTGLIGSTVIPQLDDAEAEKLTVPPRPFREETFSVKVAVPPAVTAGGLATGANVKFGDVVTLTWLHCG